MPRRRAVSPIAVVAGGLASFAFPAAASCGSAFCVANTDWSTQGSFTEPGLRLDLRYESIDLDQPRAGRDRIAVGAIPRHHDEVETQNRNVALTAEWNLSPAWGVSVVVPYLDRDHRHVHNHRGEQLPEAWSFRALGDVRVVARHEVATVHPTDTTLSSWGVTFGAKLPTGRRDVANGDGEVAERTLQPGTGTTDAIVGAYWNLASAATSLSWFARVQAVLPANERDGFKPGRQWQLDGGARYAAGPILGLLLQANYLVKGRDSGAEAEPEDSGQRQLWITPGITWTVAKNAQLYALVQLPVYQAVNGVQLAADRAWAAGVSWRF